MLRRGDQIALLIADQRMPGMAGTEYLVEARKIVPDAKRVLLTAHADTEAAIVAIDEVALDYYLRKPWDPPEEQLFPVLEDLLTTWESGAALEAGGVNGVLRAFVENGIERHVARELLALHTAALAGAASHTALDALDAAEADAEDALIETTLVILGHKLKRTTIAVTRRYDRTLPKLTVRGSELNQVWTNLLDNAIDALGQTGTIEIATRRDGSCAIVEIADDGPGIPEEVGDRIFDSFYTTKDVGYGTGLGLATAVRIVVDRHDGSLRFESKPGRTTFRVSLPFTRS